MQALEQWQHFNTLQWWKALDAHHTQTRQHLRGDNLQAPVHGSQSGSWLKGVFTLGKEASAVQHPHNNVDVLSEVDMGRIQLQLQKLDKVENEINLIRYVIEAGSSMWMRT